jgi:hypothetical protein
MGRHPQIMSIDVGNIFDLVGRFGAAEDQLTASFGFLLRHDSRLFRAFMTQVGFQQIPAEPYDITTQTFYRQFGFDESNRIDLEISATFRLSLVVESKIAGNRFSEAQLSRYARLLEDRRSRGDELRLILITHLDERDKFRRWVASTNLLPHEVHYLRWTHVCDLVERHRSPHSRRLTELFLRKVRHTMSDLKVIEELPTGTIKEVMIVTVNPESMNRALNDLQYICQNEKPTRKEARYIAFYETGGPKRIRYLAKVRETEINVQVGSEVLKVYRLDKPVLLREPLVKGKRPARFAVRYTTFDRLLNAETLDDVILASVSG